MELEDLMQESIQIMENDFYSKKFYFSYSSLNKLMWNPQSFYQTYVLGNREEKTDAHLVNGKIIHALLLEPEKFGDNFIISPDNLPTGNLRTVVDRVFAHHQELAKSGDERISLSEFADAVLDVMRDMNYYQNLKTDQQRLDKVLTNELEGYWNFLRTKGSKTLIDQETFEFCNTAVDIIKSDNAVCELIGCNITEFSNKEVYNELPLQCDIREKAFGIKGIIDNVVINHDKQEIVINDIKTTSKDLKDFPESVDYYNYWMQSAIYSTIITIKFLNLIDRGYALKFNFLVIDRNYQVYPFAVSESTLNSWLQKFTEFLHKADWHYQTRNYTLPYDFAIGKVTL